MTVLNRQAPRIVRVTLRRADGKRRWRIVKTTSVARSPLDSILGLNAKLAELTIQGHITASAVLVPATITDAQRKRLIRWPEAIDGMLDEDGSGS